jgi:HSP20 family protein
MFGELIPWKQRDKQSTGMWKGEENHPIALLRQEFDQIWDRFWSDWRAGLSERGGGLAPRVDLHETGNEYVIRAELPGFEPDDLDVKLSGNVLTVRAERKDEAGGTNGGFRRYGEFCQSFTLPGEVVADQAVARYRSGVLEIEVPKNERCQPKRIEVKSV